jgi:hypothetical protein
VLNVRTAAAIAAAVAAWAVGVRHRDHWQAKQVAVLEIVRLFNSRHVLANPDPSRSTRNVSGFSDLYKPQDKGHN